MWVFSTFGNKRHSSKRHFRWKRRSFVLYSFPRSYQTHFQCQIPRKDATTRKKNKNVNKQRRRNYWRWIDLATGSTWLYWSHELVSMEKPHTYGDGRVKTCKFKVYLSFPLQSSRKSPSPTGQNKWFEFVNRWINAAKVAITIWTWI